MTSLDFFFSAYMLFFSCFMFSFYYKHLLLTIISLEFIMISVFFNMFMILMMLESNLYLIIMFLTMGVCESALGLSLIILMVRFYGNDYINSLSMIKW